MIPPTPSQETALAFAPVPFAVLSLLSSSYVIHYLLCRARDKLQRMYHRLILALNCTLVVFSAIWIWRPFAVPVGTAYNPYAAGTVGTCTAQGFFFLMCVLTTPVYYGSLSVQAYMAIKNSFREEKYKWIEKWIHLVAICVPFALSMIVVARENFNASIGSCFLRKAPMGCEADPNVACERGKGIKYLELIVGLGLLLLYFIVPPSLTAAMYCWIGRMQRKGEGSSGMQRVRESARRQTMRTVARQISVYLFAFWSTWVFGMIQQAYRILTGGKVLYDLLVLAQCLYASQGFVLAASYFALRRLGRVQRATYVRQSDVVQGVTVSDIRLNAESRANESETLDNSTKSYDFNIFDGVPDEDSPWAKFIDPDSDNGHDDDHDGNVDG